MVLLLHVRHLHSWVKLFRSVAAMAVVRPCHAAHSAVPANDAAQPSSLASSAEQPASMNTAPSRVDRPVKLVAGERDVKTIRSCQKREQTSAAQYGPSTKRHRATDEHARAAQPGSAAGSSFAVASLAT